MYENRYDYADYWTYIASVIKYLQNLEDISAETILISLSWKSQMELKFVEEIHRFYAFEEQLERELGENKDDISQDTLRYYERVGMIPPVTRTVSSIRDYQEEDIRWVELAKCMCSAGLLVETMTEYVKLPQEGNTTIPARLQLLTDQKDLLLEQKSKIDETLERMNYKISCYEIEVETGILTWEDEA